MTDLLKTIRENLELTRLYFCLYPKELVDEIELVSRNSIISILEAQVEKLEDRRKSIDKLERSYMHPLDIGNIDGFNRCLDEQISNLKEVLKELRDEK